MHCKRCHLITDNFLAQPQCQCNTQDKSLSNQVEYNHKEVKDALFGEAIVFEERINIIINSGSKGSAIINQFLDYKN